MACGGDDTLWGCDPRVGVSWQLCLGMKNAPSTASKINYLIYANDLRQLKVRRYKTAQVLRQQFKLRPTAAKTAHRCQGSTMDAVVVDLGDYAFCHIHYVTLSRVTSMGNLHLRNRNEKKIANDADVSKEIKRLETERKFDFQANPSTIRKLHLHYCSRM